MASSTPLELSEADLDHLQGINEHVSMQEVAEIYVPLARLLQLYVSAASELHQATATFLGDRTAKVPFVIALAGSVAVGKSTTARILQTLLARCDDELRVELVTTDGFLFPNVVLSERGLVNRKGFPESYDRTALVAFLADLKAGEREVKAPIYDHRTYDVVAGRFQSLHQPDVVVLEGLNVLQGSAGTNQLFVSDLVDFSIYVDAATDDIRRWYKERFVTLKRAAVNDSTSFFSQWASMSDEAVVDLADAVWSAINAVNLDHNILPTRQRAHLILTKGPDHRVREVWVRKR